MDLVRLQKLIASHGYVSRRKAELLIGNGRVRVNGVLTRELGVKVPEDAVIEVDGIIINKEVPSVYLMLNKPTGFLCSRRDPAGRPLIYNLIDQKYLEYGVFNVGRLDFMSEGLIIITNNGHFAERISHPSRGFQKKYVVCTDQNVPYKLIDRWKNGIYINGIHYSVIDSKKIATRKVMITLCEGKNREIRKLFENIHLKVLKLKRIAIGSLELGGLPVGKYREITDEELKELLNGMSEE